MKVLIIEDEYSLADAIAETLQKEGFTVKMEADGEKGEFQDTDKFFHEYLPNHCVWSLRRKRKRLPINEFWVVSRVMRKIVYGSGRNLLQGAA